MIAKYNKSYDTANGSEQPGEQSGGQPSGQSLVKAAGQRWEDDGGSAPVQPPPSPMELSAKPAWSVLSLRELLKAIRLERWEENPAHLRRQAAETERRRVRAIEIEEKRKTAIARAERDRYRNHWENT